MPIVVNGIQTDPAWAYGIHRHTSTYGDGGDILTPSRISVTHNDGIVDLQGAFDVTRNQTIDIPALPGVVTTVRGFTINETFSAVGLTENRNLQGYFNNVSFSGNLIPTKKCSIIGQVNNISITNTSGRVGSGDAAGLYSAAFTYKTVYAPPPGSTGLLSSWTNIQSQYLHNGDSNGTTSSVIGIDQSLVFGATYKYTLINAHGLLISATFGAGAVGSSITNLYGARISAPSIGAGVTITNHYGLRIENIIGGVNNWSFYVAGGLSYFGGDVQSNANINMTGGNGKYIRVPQMTFANRPTVPAAGMICYFSDQPAGSRFMGYDGVAAAWVALG